MRVSEWAWVAPAPPLHTSAWAGYRLKIRPVKHSSAEIETDKWKDSNALCVLFLFRSTLLFPGLVSLTNVCIELVKIDMLLSNKVDMNTYVSFSMSVSRNLLLLRKSCVYIKTVDGHKFENQNFEILFVLNLQVSSLTRSMVEPSTTALSYSGILTRTKKKDSGAVRMTSV